MKITPNSHKLMSFFHNYSCLPHIKLTTSTKNIFKKLFNEIDNAVKFVSYTKNQMGSSFYKLKIKKIDSVSQITKPKTFNANALPTIIQDHINKHSLSSLTYTFQLFNRDITFIFFIEDDKYENYISQYNNYVDNMLVWLYIVNEYASQDCSNKLTVFVYHTSLTKNIPKDLNEILNENNVNTAFTSSCHINSEIVVFRKEEWFKVFIHETFHNFVLDFSDMNNAECNSKILSIFPVNSKVNLFEAYTEFWARIINVLFCSYFNTKNKNNIDEFLSNAEYFMNLESTYSFFQMVKILDFMNMEYKNLYENNEVSENIRKTLYKENTSVLSYYVITLILIYNYQTFLLWCKNNNTSLIQFKKTYANLNNFCRFIEKKYKSPKMLEIIHCSNIFFKKLLIQKKQKSTNKVVNKDLAYLTDNLRMTLCEMG
jgi:hypothetical protein